MTKRMDMGLHARTALFARFEVCQSWDALGKDLGYKSGGYLWRVAKGKRKPSLKLCRKLGIIPPPKRRPNYRRREELLRRWVRDYRQRYPDRNCPE